jgi:allantoin racemase
MKIRVIAPIILTTFNADILREVEQFTAPDVEVDVVNLSSGPASIESRFDDALATIDIMEKVQQSENEGFDGVFIDCFGDPGVDASRELVRIPVVGAFQPSVLTACLISGSFSIVTILRGLIPLVRENLRKLGVEGHVASIRSIETPVLELTDHEELRKRALSQVLKAIEDDGAEACVLGCTGMLGIASELAKKLREMGKSIPVIDPTAAAVGHLELLIRGGLSQSTVTYAEPPVKERK